MEVVGYSSPASSEKKEWCIAILFRVLVHSCRRKDSSPPSRGATRLFFGRSICGELYPFLIMIYTDDIVNKIRTVFYSGKIKRSKDARLIFVCGAALESKKGKNARKRFLDYSKKYLKEYDIFIAENFFDLFKENKDLLTIEDSLAKYSDCIIIFLESESTYSELGAFAYNDALAQQILIVNNIDYISSTSFISKGPIAKVNEISKYGKTIYANLDSVLQSVNEIVSRLELTKKKVNQTINIDNIDNYNKLSNKDRMLFLLDLITLLQPVRYQEILLVLKKIVGHGSYQIDFDLKLLTAVGYISENNGFYLKSKRNTKMFFVFEKSKVVLTIRSLIFELYRKHDRKRIILYNDIIRGVI